MELHLKSTRKSGTSKGKQNKVSRGAVLGGGTNFKLTQLARWPCSSEYGSFPEMISSNNTPKLYTSVSGSAWGGKSDFCDSCPGVLACESTLLPKAISDI